MKVVIALCFVFAVASAGLLPATTLVRTPSFDSAVIKSDRLGGNFAYSTAEGHAYAAISPVVQRVAAPVAVSYTAHQVPLGYAAAPVAVHQPYAHTVISQPLLSHQYIAQAPVVAHAPVVGAVAAAPVAPVAPVAPIADVPVQSTIVSDDTVAIESA